MISSRLELYARLTEKYPWRHDLESDSHIVTGRTHPGDIDYLPDGAGRRGVHPSQRQRPAAGAPGG